MILYPRRREEEEGRPRDVVLDKYAVPPFNFKDVIGRVFPLKADLRRLERFCDSFLNSLMRANGKEQHEFRPAVPYVLLAVLHYGQMFSAEPDGRDTSDDLFQRHQLPPQSNQPRAWASQNEVAFLVPVEWYQKENARWVFHDWAYATPFIFVDEDYSLMLGREVYGWPKLAASFSPQPEGPWITQPQNRSRVLTLRTSSPLKGVVRRTKLNVPQEEELETLLAIELESPAVFSQLRPDSNPFEILLSGPQTLLGTWAAMYDWIGTLSGLPLVGNRAIFDQRLQSDLIAKGLRNLGVLWSDIPRGQALNALLPGFSYEQAWDSLFRGLSSDAERVRVLEERKRITNRRPESAFVANQITLKQFPDTDDDNFSCYQAIVRSPMRITRYHNGGFLGDSNLLRGDPTGGFRVRFYYSDPAQEDMGSLILDQLGLEFMTRQETEANRYVATMNPFYPVWFEGDFHYGKGKKIWCRVRNGDPESFPVDTTAAD
jgi:hypothetical protein